MGDCYHMNGLKHTGDDYVPSFGDQVDTSLDVHGYSFLFCPLCGKQLQENDDG